jgi:hypothetical protein
VIGQQIDQIEIIVVVTKSVDQTFGNHHPSHEYDNLKMNNYQYNFPKIHKMKLYLQQSENYNMQIRRVVIIL